MQISSRPGTSNKHHNIFSQPQPYPSLPSSPGRRGTCVGSAMHKSELIASPTRKPRGSISHNGGAGSNPVLIQVSRRTSSPIVSPVFDQFGMHRRPSVSPIPPSPGSADSFNQLPHPRASFIRRDAKMDKLLEQISVLKATLGLSDDDLQWKVESTKGNAYVAADKRQNDAEERYDRLVYETQMLEQTPCEESAASLVKQLRALVQQSQTIAGLKLGLSNCQNDLTMRKKEFLDARIASELRLAKAGGDSTALTTMGEETERIANEIELAKTRILETQEQLKADLAKMNTMLETLSALTEQLAKDCAEFKFLSPEVAAVSSALLAIVQGIPECSGEPLVALCEQGIAAAQKLRGSKLQDLKQKETEMNRALKDIEVWKQRKEESKEFLIEITKRELRWKQDNLEANTASLRLLRSLIPQDIAQLSVEAIIERAQSPGGVLYTYDLALYLKQNRFLHWLVIHESDITRENFLAIDCAPFFLNFVAYDINELRALCCVLPDSFDFDKDGRKGDWKRQFVDHVEALVKQQNGETVKAGWDPVRRARRELPLLPLNDKQQLNLVYRYPSDDEIKARIAKFEIQKERLVQKKQKLQQLNDEAIPTAKAEYLAIAEDARSESLQKSFGKATLIKMRDDAKQSFQSLSKTRDALVSEIARGEAQWSALTPTYAQYLDEVDRIRHLDPDIRSSRIRGPFPEEVEPKPKARALFKKLSVEEEAEERRKELDSAIASRGREMVVESAVPTGSPPGESSGAQEDSTANEHQPRGTSIAERIQNMDSSKQQEAQPPPDHHLRRVKSLQVSVEVLRFLQNDFCNSKRHNPNEPASVPTSAALGETASSSRGPQGLAAAKWKSENALLARTNEVTPVCASARPEPVNVQPKSKALLQLLERQKAAASGDVPPSQERKSPMKAAGKNFLAELQSRVKGSDSNGPKEQAAKPRSFLDELKLAAGAERNKQPVSADWAAAEDAPAPKKAMNFLDELKMAAGRKKPVETDPANTEPRATIETTPQPVEPPKAMNFLEELKARALKHSN